MFSFTRRLIDPPKYKYFLKGHAPCNYSLRSKTHYRSLAKPEELFAAYQIEKDYKFKYDMFEIDWAFKSFEYRNDMREYNLILFTDKGIFREEITRSIFNQEIYMRWTTFVNKLIDRKPHLFITTEEGSKKIIWFYPAELKDHYTDPKKIIVVDTEGKSHVMNRDDRLIKAFNTQNVDYVDVDETNYIPVYWFRMWYMMF